MKQFVISLFIVAVLFSGCSNNSVPTSSDATQTSEQEISIIKIKSGVKATVPTPQPAVTVAASIDTLLPSNGTPQTVLFTGTVANVLSASYTLTDEYGIVSFGDTLSNGTFSISLSLPAITDSTDLNGRQYVFTVIGVGIATVAASDTVVVAYQAPSNGGGGNGEGDDDEDHDGDNDHDGHGHHDNGNHYGQHGKGDKGHGDHDGKGNKGNKHDNDGKHR